MLIKFYITTVYCLLFIGVSLHGQTGLERFVELFTIHPNARKVKQDSTLYPAKIILAPVITHSPETSLGLGVGAKYLFKFAGSGEETRTSNMPVSLKYTLQNQFILFSGFEIFTKEESWMLTGNIILQDFPRLFYGIGANTPELNEEEYSFGQILLEPILLKRLFARHLFLGAGIRYNYIGGVELVPQGRLANTEVPGNRGSTSVGVELAAVYDSRDNLLNAQRGLYAEFTHGFYGEVLGGTQKFELTRLDLRYFFQPFKKREDVIGFQLLFHYSHDNTPLGELAFLGGEEIMRGYYEGRYLDRHMLAAQTEYRFNIVGPLGAVVFAGVGDVAPELNEFRLGDLKPSIGAGLRFLLDREEKLNVRFDWGFGRSTNNYYLNVAEAF